MKEGRVLCHREVMFKDQHGGFVPIANIITIRPVRDSTEYDVAYRLDGRRELWKVPASVAQDLLNRWEVWLLAHAQTSLDGLKDARRDTHHRTYAADLRIEARNEMLEHFDAMRISQIQQEATRIAIEQTRAAWPGYYYSSDQLPLRVINVDVELNSCGELAPAEDWSVVYEHGGVLAETWAGRFLERFLRGDLQPITEAHYEFLMRLTYRRCLPISC